MFSEKTKGVLADHTIIRVFPPFAGKKSHPLEGVVRLLSTSLLEVHFPPEKFSAEELDPDGEWEISWEQGDIILSAKARMDRLTEDNRAFLEITEIFFHQSTRRLFRVDAGVYLHYWPVDLGVTPERPPVRKKVNISGCGIRFETAEPLEPDRQVALEITLPGSTLEVVSCLCRVVRSEEKDNGAFEVALEIVQAPRRDLDKIMTFCMTEQFKKMHSKVKAMGAVLSPSLEKEAFPPETSSEDEIAAP
jgi:hypothetical protein